jgi:hypothetical protein
VSAQERVVRHALLDYVDPDGVRRVALRGQTVRIDGDALQRAEELEALEPVDADESDEETADESSDEEGAGAASSPPGAQEPALPPLAPADVVLGDESDGDEADGKPPKAAAKDAWVDFAVAQGADQGEAEAMTKAELIERFGS